MQQVVLHNTPLRLSRLSFGTAMLHHSAFSGDRRNLLASAYDCGFTHFDTAPLYGYGIAEEELGRFLQRGARNATVATKVGLYPPPGASPKSRSVWFRKAAGKVIQGYGNPTVEWSVATASRSLDTSLRRLKRDYVDLLLLHEPEAGALNAAAFTEWLETEHSAGRIRAFGISGDAHRIRGLLDNDKLSAVLQVRDSLVEYEADLILRSGRTLQLTYGYLSSLPSSKRGTDVANVLRAALGRNESGSVLVSSRDIARVAQLARIASEAPRVEKVAQTS